MNLTAPLIDTSKLRDIELSDKAKIDAIMTASKSRGCENSFATIYMWSAAYGFKILELAGRVLIYNSSFKLFSYPFGSPTPPDKLLELFIAFKSGGLINEEFDFIYNLPVDYPQKFPEAAELFDIKSDESDFDYLYSIEKLIESSGSKLRKKRNQIKHFMLACPVFGLEAVNASNIAIAKDFMVSQSLSRNLEDEAKAIASGFDNFNELGLKGIILRCPRENVAAAAIFSPLAEGVYDVHFEKSTRDVEGASQMIVLQEAVAIKNLGGTLMNREQDMGEENLRRAKESLDPLEKLPRLRAYLKK